MHSTKVFSTLIALCIFSIVHAMVTDYEPFKALSHTETNEINFESSLHSKTPQHDHQLMNCGLLQAVKMVQLQQLVEVYALKNEVTPFAVLGMLHKRFKSINSLKEDMPNTINEPPNFVFPSPQKVDLHSKIRLHSPPHPPYFVYPSNSIPHIKTEKENSNVVFIPLDSPASPIKHDFKNRGEPVPMSRPLLPSIKNKASQLKAAFTAIVRIYSRDSRTNLNRDMTITVSPKMTVLEALRQAEMDYQKFLGVKHGIFSFAPSASDNCYILYSVNDVANTENATWKITIEDKNSKVLHDNICLPNEKDIFIEPRTLISLEFVPV